MPKVLSLSKNEDFKTVLGGKKILNKFVTIYYKKLTINDKNKFNPDLIVKIKRNLPEFTSTHPFPENRSKKIRDWAKEVNNEFKDYI